MPHKIELKYRTFGDLLDAVRGSMPKQDINGFIDEGELIPIAQNVNKYLTVSINQTKEDVFVIDNYRVKLPDDFYLLNFSLACSQHEVSWKSIDNITVHAESKCICSCSGTDSETELTITKDCKDRVVKWKNNQLIKIVDPQFIRTDCPNKQCNSIITGYIKNGYLWLNVETGHIYLNYASVMEDDNGELLVLDHDLVNPYYEYSLKKRILENMLYKGEDVGNILKYTIGELRNAKIIAESVNFMPDYNRLVDFLRMERQKTKDKFFRPYGY